MYGSNNILCIIPARGGSKGLIKKNLKEIGGVTLVEWALRTALSCNFMDRTIISSDSKEIINLVNKHGNFAPFIRPKELAMDDTPSLPVFQHTLEWVESTDQKDYQFVIVLEPNSPFRLSSQIEEGLNLAIKKNASSVVSLVKVEDQHPVRIKKLRSNGQVEPFCLEEPEGLKRQDQEPAYIRNSAIYIFKSLTLESNRLYGDNPYGFEVDRKYYAINIDEEADLFFASYLYDKLQTEKQLHKILPVDELKFDTR